MARQFAPSHRGVPQKCVGGRTSGATVRLGHVLRFFLFWFSRSKAFNTYLNGFGYVSDILRIHARLHCVWKRFPKGTPFRGTAPYDSSSFVSVLCGNELLHACNPVPLQNYCFQTIFFRSRPGKPNQRNGQNEKFTNFARFCEFCFFLGKQARFTSNFCSSVPPGKVHELAFLWFGLPGWLLNFVRISSPVVCICHIKIQGKKITQININKFRGLSCPKDPAVLKILRVVNLLRVVFLLSPCDLLSRRTLCGHHFPGNYRHFPSPRRVRVVVNLGGVVKTLRRSNSTIFAIVVVFLVRKGPLGGTGG